MEQIRFERIGETMFHQVLDNGLNVFVFPKPEFQKKYAFFATNYGGMDLRFQLDGTWHDTPAGVAHYLEHKMFDTREGNALQQLTANGASPNAFTSNAITGYYFESTEHFEENLRTLLSFVSVPYFTRESVEKERGIIGQEIGMIEDDPNWTVFVNLLGALYEHHPIRTSVAGTVESISHITEETLYACHKAFYDPANMVLCAAGDLDPQAVCRLAREVLPTQAGPIAEKDYGPEEPSRAARGLVEEHMAVSCPIFQLGCKGDAPVRGEAGLRQELLGDLACEVLLGTSTPLYARLYREGLVVSKAAKEEDSVIVGRCADFILKDDDVDILSVFITAPLADRITREMDVDDMNETQARKFIRKMDMRRKNYYNYFTKGDWGKKNTYDLILNSSKLGVEGTVDILCSLYRNFMGQ